MSWKRLKELSRTLTFRVAAWYIALFVCSAILILWLAYALVGTAIDRKDRNMIEARLREYVAVYQHGGASALRDWAGRINKARGQRMFFVRVMKSPQSVEMEVMPEDWTENDLRLLNTSSRQKAKNWLRIQRNSDVDLTVASTVLKDGTIIQVGQSSDSRGKLLSEFRQIFAVVVLPVIAIELIGGIILTSRMTRPIRSVVNTAAAIINTGRMDLRVPVRPANDELRDLAVLFNRMLECNEELFRALRDSLDNVAHDLRTPLARLRATLEESMEARSDGAAREEWIGQALEEVESVKTIIKTLMEVTEAEAGLMKLRIENTDIRNLINDAAELYEEVADEKHVSIATEFSTDCIAPVDPVRIRQVFANLLDNAIKYTPSGGRILISAARCNGELEVKISDTGMGITEAELPRIWERLYRGDKSRTEYGLGLGLNLVRAIVEAHQGRVEVSSVPDVGTEFKVYLPFKTRAGEFGSRVSRRA